MKRISIRLTLLFLTCLLGITGGLLLPVLFPSISVAVYAFPLSQAPTSSPSPAISPEAILGIVGPIGPIVAAIIAVLFGMYQMHRAKKIEYEKRKIEQEKQEMQQRLDSALRRE